MLRVLLTDLTAEQGAKLREVLAEQTRGFREAFGRDAGRRVGTSYLGEIEPYPLPFNRDGGYVGFRTTNWPRTAPMTLSAELQPLMPPDQLNAALRLASTLRPADVVSGLVARGWLTEYQADEVRGGRGAALVVGSYVLLDKLGEGGMGEVFRARHNAMGREVALKRVLAKRLGSADAIQRFVREVRAVSMLSHPNVVQVYDAGAANGVHFLAMELLQGTNLADHLDQRGPLPVGEAIEYVRQAWVGMQHAHEKGLVHRDLKPGNLMRTEQRQIKILDLGLALVVSASTLTQAGQTGFGTVDYMAPEQVTDSHKVDIRADVYSLGCSLYHLLAGKTPFDEAHPAARPAMHMTKEPPSVESRRADVPSKVADVVRKMMCKSPEGRYQTPGEAAEVLGGFMRRRSEASGEVRPLVPAPTLPLPAKSAKGTMAPPAAMETKERKPPSTMPPQRASTKPPPPPQDVPMAQLVPTSEPQTALQKRVRREALEIEVAKIRGANRTIAWLSSTGRFVALAFLSLVLALPVGVIAGVVVEDASGHAKASPIVSGLVAGWWCFLGTQVLQVLFRNFRIRSVKASRDALAQSVQTRFAAELQPFGTLDLRDPIAVRHLLEALTRPLR